MNKLPYSYKGRPIISSGRRSPGGTHVLSNSDSRKRQWWKWLIVLAVAGGILYFIFRMPSTAKTEQVNDADKMAKTENAVAETPKAPVSAAEVLSNADAVLDEIVKTVSPAGTAAGQNLPQQKKEQVSAEMQRQAMSLYSQAVKTLNEGKYEESRKLIRPVFRMITPDHPLYSQAQNLLRKTSMQLYNSGKDSGAALIYVVKSGDNLTHIAKQHKTSVGAIQQASGLTSNNLRIGQKLKIPRNIWRIQIDRKISRMMLYNSAQLFAIYTFRMNQSGNKARLGSYKMQSKRIAEGKKVIFDFHSAHYGTNILCMSGNVQRPDSDSEQANQNADFLFTNNDATELFRLIPEGTPAEIIK